MIRFGSRGSDLALTQSRQVAEELRRRTGEDFTIEVIETRGDKNIADPLPQIGGKGLFTAELEQALLEDRIDVAVHSLKDLPVEDPDGLTNGAIPQRERVNDVLVFRPDARDPEGGTIPLLGGSLIGTSSPRRSSSILTLRPDISLADIRGNVDTRARKVAEGHYAATILAAAGMRRLGLQTPDLLRVELPVEAFTPAPGQGALGVQCRRDDERVRSLLAAIHDEVTAACVGAERRLLYLLGGGCSMPLGALVQPADRGGYRMLVSLFSTRQPACGVQLELFGDDADALANDAAAQLKPLLDDPLRGRRVAVLRPGSSGGKLSKALALAGAEVETVAVTETLPLPVDLTGLPDGALATVAFTSARAVDRFFEEAAIQDVDLGATRFFAVGPATADAVRHRGHACAEPDAPAGGAQLARFLITALEPGAPVLFPCAEGRHGDLESALSAAGHPVTPLPAYRTLPLYGVEVPAADHVVLTSPSAVEACRDATLAGGDLIALGATTAAAMTAAGLVPAGVAEHPTPQALVGLLQSLPRDTDR